MQKECLAGEAERAARRFQFDRAAFRAFKLGGFESRKKIERLTDPRLQILVGRFGILPFRWIDAAESCGCALRKISHQLHLASEREHIGEQAGAEQHAEFIFVGVGVGFGFF